MIVIMRSSATKRADSKQESQDRILDAAARRLREEGLTGAGIAAVMRDAGLTHGAFYSHFSTKDELASAAFAHAIGTGRPHWIKPTRGESWRARLTSLAKRYLTPAHRDDLATSCAFAALGSEAARGSDEFRAAYERELRTSLSAICGDDTDDERFDEAIALMALCVGGMTLSRAVADPEFSARILQSARAAAAKVAEDQPHRGGRHGQR
ncbi:TetR/AcrR family transcriptional regulator [Mycobacterium sp. CBMA247]|nr:TetR/AcrR family transcriptional regulator [Mycolicibacterium sp. CBMA 329]MUL88141.1 TetR/AcrR family transcriptional regulator [Mycolicibacterium sp. CBMA 331]MUM02470.1 TetR/AcrR family transcriptional regulator [Mycolicibacterium sp. CBMA 334]MUM26012.1 TetR/AcrR family transcriptional regulator [Mycolicibacterium sp. CBMA 295]MUM39788.1 TetR/AcrR family transcriptional regulator [Mycolicibacterium sp. CBMA 247]MUM44206.1 TetR/AcrR family transcriptional regulator [Mycolicibacterium sp.